MAVERNKAMAKRTNGACENGISTQGAEKLRKSLTDYENVVKTKLGEGLPAKVPPLQMKLKPGAMPVQTEARLYTPAKHRFLERIIAKLVHMGIVVQANTLHLHPLLSAKFNRSSLTLLILLSI